MTGVDPSTVLCLTQINTGPLFQFRIPLLRLIERPLWRFIYMAEIATVGVFGSYRDSRGDKVERMVARLSSYGILASLWHMAIDTLASGTACGVVSVF